MKTKDFIQAWVAATDPDATLVITMGQETQQDIHITTTGTSTIKRCYGWSCNERCLFYHDEPVCFKAYGMLLCHQRHADLLKAPFKELKVRCYTFDNTISDYETIMKQAFAIFYEGATKATILDDVILTWASTLNCKYEDKYLEYCRKLPLDKFREVTKKHFNRLMQAQESKKELHGLWYS